MKYFLMAAMLLFTSGSTLAQEDVKAKRAAYYLCTGHTETDPHKACLCAEHDTDLGTGLWELMRFRVYQKQDCCDECEWRYS